MIFDLVQSVFYKVRSTKIHHFIIIWLKSTWQSWTIFGRKKKNTSPNDLLHSTWQLWNNIAEFNNLLIKIDKNL